MKIELRNLGNYPKGGLTFVSGRPNIGKTSSALSSHLFYHVNKLKSAYLSLEGTIQTFERDIIDKCYNMGEHIKISNKKNKGIKLIFLDIDGVMTSNNLTKEDYEDKIYPFSKNSVTVLNQILKSNDTEIILTSSWRTIYNKEQQCQIFEENGVTQTPIDMTPDLGYENRAQEIKEYLRNKEIENFIILDDMSIEGFNDNFLRIDPKTGLESKHIQEVNNILNKNSNQSGLKRYKYFVMPPKYEMLNLFHIKDDIVTSEDVISDFSLAFRDCDVFFIDYFQLLSDNKSFGEREKKLKEIAEAYNIAIVCLSQVDRQLELREDKRLNPKDLESIGIDTSQIDKAIFLYRPSYYNSKDFKHSLESLNMTAEEYSEIICYEKQTEELKLKSIIYNSFDKNIGI